MQNWEGIRCKSFSLPGTDGGELIISETIDRKTIEVSIRCDTGQEQLTACSVSLTKLQFEALCCMNSSYDGLEVKAASEITWPDDAPEVAVPMVGQ